MMWPTLQVVPCLKLKIFLVHMSIKLCITLLSFLRHSDNGFNFCSKAETILSVFMSKINILSAVLCNEKDLDSN